MSVFVDGSANYPSCRCKPDCDFPCWQMVGLSDEPCQACGCAPFDFQPVVVNAGRPEAEAMQPNREKES